jgi:hypothetical protein
MTIKSPEILKKMMTLTVKWSIVFIAGLFILRPPEVFSQVITNQGASVNVIPGTIVQSGDAINNAGILSNSGTINLSGSYTSTGTTGGNGVYTLGGSWTNTGGTFIPGSSTVIFNDRMTSS